MDNSSVLTRNGGEIGEPSKSIAGRSRGIALMGHHAE